MRLILHVGAPKTGSSSLQRVLTKDFSLGMANNQDLQLARYAIWASTGEILQPDWRLRLKPPQSWLGYLNSGIRFESLSDHHVLRAFERTLSELNASGRDIVLSSEEWLAEARQLEEQGVVLAGFLQMCSQLGVQTECVLYVRPQVQWLNSAYWQWDFWAGTSTEEFLAREVQSRSGDWCVSVAALHRLGFTRVETRYARDVVSDFLGYLGYDENASSHGQVNAASNARDLWVLSKFPQLRSVHDPSLEFALAGPDDNAVRPWAFTNRQVSDVVASFAKSNSQLAGLLPDASRDAWAEDVSATHAESWPEVTHPRGWGESWVESAETERLLEQALQALKSSAPAWQLEALQEEVRLLRHQVLALAIDQVTGHSPSPQGDEIHTEG